jgi:formylglycine-generating enzyme required for sulfatase activity
MDDTRKQSIESQPPSNSSNTSPTAAAPGPRLMADLNQAATSGKNSIGDRTEREKVASIPPIDAIPEQDLTTAIGFRATEDGPLDLVGDPPTDPHDSEQSELYSRIRKQLEKLKVDIPTQERSRINDAVDDFLDQPKSWSDVRYKKLLWLSGNTLRALLAQHDAEKNDPEHYTRLPPSVAEALRNPVWAWSILVQGDKHLAQIDHHSFGPQEQQHIRDSLKAGKSIVSKASDDRSILTEQAADAVEAVLKSASSSSTDINTRLAQGLADKTSKNLVSQIMRRAYLLMDAIRNPDSDAGKKLTDGLLTGAGSAVGTALVAAGWNHGLPYLEFIATNPSLVREYVLVAFQNSSMSEIVDALEFEYHRWNNETQAKIEELKTPRLDDNNIGRSNRRSIGRSSGFDASPRMIEIPAGEFVMGSPSSEGEPDEHPERKVVIENPFEVSITPITRAEFAAFIKATHREIEIGAYVWDGHDWKDDLSKSWLEPGFPQKNDHPVVCISWYDAKAYVAWLTEQSGISIRPYRLLSEAEWEYCCRAGTRTPYSTGETITIEQANLGDSAHGTMSILHFPPNPWGLCDMHGNVWEWCEDSWHENYSANPPTTGPVWQGGDRTRRIIRGGAWCDPPEKLRSANRNWERPASRFSSVGFRIARTL